MNMTRRLINMAKQEKKAFF